MEHRLRVTFWSAILTLVCGGLAPASGATCESLSTLTVPNTRIVAAVPQPAGRFTPPGAQPGPPTAAPNPALDNLPAFCRVTASLHPTSDSDIRIEVWLPGAGWNGKLQSVGNGGWAGTIGYPALAAALSAGYAAAATDRMQVIERWVEQGQAPSRIIASHATAGTIDRTRPLCAYPEVAISTGTGSTNDAASFVCKHP